MSRLTVAALVAGLVFYVVAITAYVHFAIKYW
jgi:hypothetical protein